MCSSYTVMQLILPANMAFPRIVIHVACNRPYNHLAHELNIFWNIKYSTNKCTIIITIILDIIYHNHYKQVQHVSIPSWDHHQGHLWEYKLHKRKPTI
jgi:hypothetical protein